jgi:hypothetical protein
MGSVQVEVVFDRKSGGQSNRRTKVEIHPWTYMQKPKALEKRSEPPKKAVGQQ